MKRLFAAAVLALSSMIAFGQTLTMTPNTSATSTTPAFSNGTLSGQANVSKVNIHSLLYSGSTTKVLVHYLGWFDGGNDGGINVNYSNSDSTYMNKFFTDIVSRGVDGILVDWQGPNDITATSWLGTYSIIHGYTTLAGDKLRFAIMLDQNLITNGSYTGTDTQKVLAAMNGISGYLSDASYLTYNSKLIVADFGLTSFGPNGTNDVDWASVQAAYPNVQFIHLDNASASGDGFSIADSVGSFAWVNATATSLGSAPDLSYLDNFYTRAKSHTTQVAIGTAFKGFNANPYATWDQPYHYADQQCGATWLNTFTKINNAYAGTGKQLPFLQLTTWNDYYEGTPLETGIDNCLALNISMSGRTMNLSMSAANLATLDHIEIWGMWSDGQWHYITYPANTTQIPFSNPGTAYVKAVGKPGIADWLSPGIVIN